MTESVGREGKKGLFLLSCGTVQTNMKQQGKRRSDGQRQTQMAGRSPHGDHLFCLFCHRAFEIYRTVAVTGLSDVILPAALISDLHDWSGILLGLFVFLHLFLNRRWIISTTKKILAGSRKES